tara:strand:- start:1028 stop:1201 length:174 start_codon:yes stop_codon:yes gene_type:complete
MLFTCKYKTETEEAEIKFHEEFENMDIVLKMDSLQDALAILTEKYESMFKSEQVQEH